MRTNVSFLAAIAGCLAVSHLSTVHAQSADAAPTDTPQALTAPAPSVAPATVAPVAVAQTYVVTQELPATPVSVRGDEPRTPGDRARLAIWQTIVGAGIGSEVCALAECEDTRAWIASALVGGAAGATVSVMATRKNGVRAPAALLYNSAPFVGTFLTTSLFRATARRTSTVRFLSDAHTFEHPRAALGAAIVGQVGSYGLAYAIDRGFQPTTGEVTAGLSSGAWLTLYTYLAVSDARGFGDRTDASERRLHGVLPAVAVGGAALGGFVANRVGMSGGRAMVLNGGGVLGGGLGALLAFFVRSDDVSSHGLTWSAIGGSVGGIGLTYFLTRNMDAHGEGLPNGMGFTVSPTQGGAIAQVSGYLR